MTSSILALLLVAGSCRRNSPVTTNEPSPIEPQAIKVVVPWRIEPTPAAPQSLPERPTPQQDSLYRSKLLTYLLARVRTTTPVRLTPRDTIDFTNYQSEGGWLGVTDITAPWSDRRFFTYATRYSSGVMVFTLDTAVRQGSQDELDSRRVDSIAVRGLRPTERFANRCKFGSREVDDRLMGVTPDSVPEKWMRPRLAWFVDTLTVRIRRIRPDSVSCILLPTGDGD